MPVINIYLLTCWLCLWPHDRVESDRVTGSKGSGWGGVTGQKSWPGSISDTHYGSSDKIVLRKYCIQSVISAYSSVVYRVLLAQHIRKAPGSSPWYSHSLSRNDLQEPRVKWQQTNTITIAYLCFKMSKRFFFLNFFVEVYFLIFSRTGQLSVCAVHYISCMLSCALYVFHCIVMLASLDQIAKLLLYLAEMIFIPKN